MSGKASYSFGYFSGINTVDEDTRLSPKFLRVDALGEKAIYPLVEAVNIDIDNTYAISSRDGSNKKLSGTDAHSFWTNGDVALFVDGATLYLLNPDYTATELLTGLSRGFRMSYAEVNDRIYMSNGCYIGYYNGSMNSLRVPTETFKTILPAGQRIAYHKGILLVAKGRVLYLSDALCDHYDVRTGFRVFENNITMLRPVDDGIFVADGKTWYLIEKRAFADDPSEYKKELVCSFDAVPFSDISVDGLLVGEGIEGKVAMWLSSEGVCVGDNKGAFKVVTPNYIMSPAGRGAAAVRNIDGVVHYLATLN